MLSPGESSPQFMLVRASAQSASLWTPICRIGVGVGVGVEVGEGAGEGVGVGAGVDRR
ncbi:MAG: hypothetical protein ACUVUE_08300 [Candidatus Bathycorpusculaceae bacterium]